MKNLTNVAEAPLKNEVKQLNFEKAVVQTLERKKDDTGKMLVETDETGYGAVGSIASALFWFDVSVSITNGKSFSGQAFGVGFPGGGFLAGDVYTDDINRLYSETTSFAFIGALAYSTVIFMDDDSNVLGSFQAGSVSTVLGNCGGGGKWE